MTGGWMRESIGRSSLRESVAQSTRTYASGGLCDIRKKAAQKARRKAKSEQRIGTGWIAVKNSSDASNNCFDEDIGRKSRTRSFERSTLLMPQHQQRHQQRHQRDNESGGHLEQSTLSRVKPVTYYSNVQMGEFGLISTQKKQARLHKKHLRDYESRKADIRERRAQNEAVARRKRDRILQAEQRKNFKKFRDELHRRLQVYVCRRSTVPGQEWVTTELIEHSVVKLQSWSRGFSCRGLSAQLKYKEQLIAAKMKSGRVERTQV
jgi:hypothetical protein